ncbi:hypothetical protein MMC30_005328 [Trapelia coarctata]|nr:hypothetical protein [Trapelia coarctata]
MPATEIIDTVDFLIWLLAGSSEDYTTCSSDIAGIATILSELGFTALGADGLEAVNTEAPCILRYSPLFFLYPGNGNSTKNGSERLRREQSCTVSLIRPEQCFTSFPINRDAANRCCAAWKALSAASELVKLEVAIPSTPNGCSDLLYVVTDKGRSDTTQRIRMNNVNYRMNSVNHGRNHPNYHYARNDHSWDLVEAHSLLVNDELYSAACRHLNRQHSQLLLKQTTGTADTDEGYVFDNEMTDLSKINAFTVFQAFFMGYYYGVFLQLVDITSLEVQSIDGVWGFRSARLLTDMRTFIASLREENSIHKSNEFTRSRPNQPYPQPQAGLSREKCTQNFVVAIAEQSREHPNQGNYVDTGNMVPRGREQTRSSDEKPSASMQHTFGY